jgi:hypothetical protein
MKAWMLRQELLHFLSSMNRVFVPHQDNRTAHLSKQVFEKSDNLVARDAALIRSGPQSDAASAGCDEQSADVIHSLVVLDARPDFGRLALGCPRPFDGTNQRLSVFIDKNERGGQFTPLFLS